MEDAVNNILENASSDKQIKQAIRYSDQSHRKVKFSVADRGRFFSMFFFRRQETLGELKPKKYRCLSHL